MDKNTLLDNKHTKIMQNTSDFTILIVDDVPQNIQILGKIIAEKGYNVEFATSGTDALDWVNSKVFDLILLDIMMPEMNGYEVCNKLKNNEETRNIPIIFMTALADTESKIRAFELGAVDYVTKPFESVEVLARINTHISLSNLQKRLLDANKNLEEIVQERTSMLIKTNKILTERNSLILRMNDDLRQAKEKAEESDRLKSSFLKNMSHEVRTPLNAITGFAELLTTTSHTPEKIKQYAKIINNNSEKLINIITDVLEISQVDANQVQLSMKQINFGDFFNNILNEFKPLIENKKLNLYCKEFTPNDEIIIRTDEAKLFKIFWHIIDNAIKYTPEGQIDIIYHQTKDYIYVDIKDTGIGIQKEMLEKIFEPFRQVELGMRRKFGGNGVGLTLARAYTNYLGGTLSLDSEYGKGTSVLLKFPLIEKNTNEPDNIKNYNKAILIAEDEQDNYLFLAEIIEEIGIKILHAKNGREAVEICKQNSDIGLVLMDIKMPELSGYLAACQIREFNIALPIIAQSAYKEETDKGIKDLIFTDYLLKPINSVELRRKLSLYLK